MDELKELVNIDTADTNPEAGSSEPVVPKLLWTYGEVNDKANVIKDDYSNTRIVIPENTLPGDVKFDFFYVLKKTVKQLIDLIRYAQ